jgi:hypothetical protein
MAGVIFSRSEIVAGVRVYQEGDYVKSESMSGVGVWRKLECSEGSMAKVGVLDEKRMGLVSNTNTVHQK